MSSIGKTNYGIACSFYNRRCNVCSIEKKPGKKPEKLETNNGKELSWSQDLGISLAESVEKLRDTVTEVAKLQAAENERTNMHKYWVPIAVAWPGYQNVGTNDLQFWEGRYPDIDYSRAPDNSIANVCDHLKKAGNEHCRVSVDHGILNRLPAAYKAAVTSVNQTHAAKLKSLYERAKKHEQSALDELIEEAQSAAAQRAQLAAWRIKYQGYRPWFFVYEQDHQQYFNLPEVRDAMQETMESILGYRLRIRFPGDDSNEHFFDIVSPMIETFTEWEEQGKLK